MKAFYRLYFFGGERGSITRPDLVVILIGVNGLCFVRRSGGYSTWYTSVVMLSCVLGVSPEYVSGVLGFRGLV